MVRILFVILLSASFSSYAQQGWSVCNTPTFRGRVNDLFMVNIDTGYAICGDGKIVKTTDKGNNWFLLLEDANAHCRSIEFINERKGFVGSFWLGPGQDQKILRKTIDGGVTWSDITTSVSPKAGGGICGLAIPDSNTVYGCGNWHGDSAYIVKSVDGGNTWSFIGMGQYASSLIDMHFINKDTGFAVGKDQTEKAIVLYTTDGGQNWSVKYQNDNTGDNGYAWKIQRLSQYIYFAALQSLTGAPARIIKSSDGGMNWTEIIVNDQAYNVQGTGFISPLKGWAGGDHNFSFETNDGGATWKRTEICPIMNRVWRVNDTMMLAAGSKIWKYTTGPGSILDTLTRSYVVMKSYPNPANDKLTVDIWLTLPTRVMLVLYDHTGKRVRVSDNSNRPHGQYKYNINTSRLPAGTYILVLKTHEDQSVQKIVIAH